MAVTGITGQPEVVKAGGMVEEKYDYVDGGTFEAGDLIRINTAGEVVVAGTTTAAPPQGMTLFAVDAEANEQAPIVLFDDDTVISIPCVDGVAPEDLSKGKTYTLETSDGVWGVTATTTAGVATVVGYADDAFPFTDRYGTFSQDSSVDNNRVLVRIKRATLDIYAA